MWIRKKSKISDTLIGHNKEKFTSIIQQYESLSNEYKAQLDLVDLGHLGYVFGEISFSHKCYQQADQLTNFDSLKGLIAYNQYINCLETDEYEKALSFYLKSIKYHKQFELFPSATYIPIKILNANGLSIIFLCQNNQREKYFIHALNLPVTRQQCRDIKEYWKNVFQIIGDKIKIESPYSLSIKEFACMDWQKYGAPYVVMKYEEVISLSNYIETNDHIPFEQGIILAYNIAKGMEAFHNANILHTNLCPDNIFVNQNTCKITNFGFILIPEQLQYISIILGKNKRTIAEQYYYMKWQYGSPEQWGLAIDNKIFPIQEYSDIYSYGKLLKLIFFHTLEPNVQTIRSFPNIKIINLIEECLQKNPKQRPQTFSEIIVKLDEIKTQDIQKTMRLQKMQRGRNVTLRIPEIPVSPLNQKEDPIQQAIEKAIIERKTQNESQPQQQEEIKQKEQQVQLQQEEIKQKEQQLQLQEKKIKQKEQQLQLQVQKIKQKERQLQQQVQKIKQREEQEQQEQQKKAPDTNTMKTLKLPLMQPEQKDTSLNTAPSIVDEDAIFSKYDLPKDHHDPLQVALEERILGNRKQEEARLNRVLKELRAERAKQEKAVQELKAEREKLEGPTPYYIGSVSPKGFIFTHKRKFTFGLIQQEVEEYIHHATEMEFILIPSGIFEMGSRHFPSEQPIHKVQVDQFLMAKYPCTQSMWEKIMQTTPWKGKRYVRSGEMYPAVYISWNDCQEFCKKTGFSLPSEAQWEYACRALSKLDFCFGDDYNLVHEYAWDRGNAWDKLEKYAHKVGEKAPNIYGLYDMHGNIYEWCQDDWHDTYQDAPIDGQAWIETPPSNRKINRGGSFSSLPLYYRSSNRSASVAEYRAENLGARFCFVLS